MEKEMVQSLEWVEAQKIEISVELCAAAKQHLHFLRLVDENQWLYDGPMLERAVYRYNAYWLPLLAKYLESSPISEGPLVPPLDCEWIWHCHRLNPVRYKSDCEQLYGRVLDNYGIVSANGICKLRTENLWKKIYPMEPYVLDLDKAIGKLEDFPALEKCTTYDLVSAVKRQSSFYGKVSRAHVDSDINLQEAVGRYKAFLYLTKRNREKLIEILSVPTKDIDLIWHTHQLNPSAYYKDMVNIFGNILQHDDTDTNGSQRLKTGFSRTTTQWEEIFGQVYWKASAETITIEKKSVMYRGCTWCVTVAAVAEKKNDRCLPVVAECLACSQCAVTVIEKKSALCLGCSQCFVTAVEKKNASCAECFPCGVEGIEKNGAPICGTICLGAETEKNSGCGIVMHNHDNENAPLAEVQNDAVAT